MNNEFYCEDCGEFCACGVEHQCEHAGRTDRWTLIIKMAALIAALMLIISLSGCAVTVDKRVTLINFGVANVRTSNSSTTDASGNTASAEADLKLPGIP